MAKHRVSHAHGVSRAHPSKKHAGVTHKGHAGMHKHTTQLPGPAHRDAWKGKGRATGQG